MIVDREVASVVVQRLCNLKGESPDGRLPDGTLSRAADILGVPASTLSQWVTRGGLPPQRRKMPRYTLAGDDEALTVLTRFNAHRSTAYDHLVELRGAENMPSRSTFYRAFRALPRFERDGITLGEVGIRQHRAVKTYEPEHRNDHWQVDHQQLNIWIQPSNPKHHAFRPYMTVFEDAYSRAVMSYVISSQPNQSDVLNGLGAAVRLRPRMGPFCGVPRWLTSDRGTELISDSVIEALTLMQITAMPTLAGHPEHNGKVERLHQTIDTNFVTTLPGYLKGKSDRKGRPVGGNLAVPATEFYTKLKDWVEDYNLRRPHSALAGQTPLEAWNGDPTELSIPPESLLRRYLAVAGRLRTISRNVIRFGGQDRHYIGDFLPERNGEQVEIRYDQNDSDHIEVYAPDGEHLGTAVRKDRATPEQTDAWVQKHEALEKRLRAAASAAGKDARRTATSVIDDRPPRETTDPPPAAAQNAQHRRTRRGRDILAAQIRDMTDSDPAVRR